MPIPRALRARADGQNHDELELPEQEEDSSGTPAEAKLME